MTAVSSTLQASGRTRHTSLLHHLPFIRRSKLDTLQNHRSSSCVTSSSSSSSFVVTAIVCCNSVSLQDASSLWCEWTELQKPQKREEREQRAERTSWTKGILTLSLLFCVYVFFAFAFAFAFCYFCVVELWRFLSWVDCHNRGSLDIYIYITYIDVYIIHSSIAFG